MEVRPAAWVLAAIPMHIGKRGEVPRTEGKALLQRLDTAGSYSEELTPERPERVKGQENVATVTVSLRPRRTHAQVACPGEGWPQAEHKVQGTVSPAGRCARMEGGLFPAVVAPAARDGDTTARSGPDKQTLQVCEWPKQVPSFQAPAGSARACASGGQCTRWGQHARVTWQVSAAQAGPTGQPIPCPGFSPHGAPRLSSKPQAGCRVKWAAPREESLGSWWPPALQTRACPPPRKGGTEAGKDPQDPQTVLP